MSAVNRFRTRLSAIISPTPSQYELVVPATGSYTTTTIPKLGEEERVELDELETVYKVDEIVQGIIHKYTVAILGGGMYIESKNSKTRKGLEAFIKEVKLQNELREVIKNIFIFGSAYMEIVFNRGKTRIAKLPSIDPKLIDFRRDDATHEVVLNQRTKEPLGFTYEAWTRAGRKEVNLPRHKVAFFKFFSLSSEWRGYSPLETLIKVVQYRKNVDVGIGESGYRSAYPAYVLYIGDAEHFPNPPKSAIDAGAAELKKIGTQTVFSFPWYYKLDRLPIEGMTELARFSDHFINEICAALLFPKGLLTLPERGAGALMERQLAEWEKTVEGFQEILATQITEQILDKACELLGLVKDFELKFRILSPVTERDRARTIASLVRAGAIIPGPELDKHLRVKFGIPLEKEPRAEIPEGVAIKKLFKDVIREVMLEMKEDDINETLESRDESE